MAHRTHVNLMPAEEVALRRIALRSAGVSQNVTRRLQRLGLVEQIPNGWRLTPLGFRRHGQLARAPLLAPRPPGTIDSILDHYIPLAQAAGIARPDSDGARREDVDGEAGRLGRSTARILVVEDSYVQAEDMAALLGASGYEVVGPIGRLASALEMATSQPLDGALLDIDLGGDHCFEVATRLKERNIPLAFVSGYPPSIMPQSGPLRSLPFVAKPFEAGQLISMVRSFAPADKAGS